MRAGVIVLLTFCLATTPALSRGEDDVPATRLSRGQKALLLNAGSAVAIIAWGAANWNYFSQKPRTHNEGWFGPSTDSGGADKLGHAYSSYLLSHAFTALYRSWGYDETTAIRYGCYSAFGVTGIMEVGDSFSDDYGFSYEDMLMNLVGAGFAYVTATHPELDRKLDFRWEYKPNVGHIQGDFLTDYDHSKYLLALKADGFDGAPTWLRPFETHVGYYTRDLELPFGEEYNERTLYAAIGINMTHLVRPFYATQFFDYFQLPYIYLALEKDLD